MNTLALLAMVSDDRERLTHGDHIRSGFAWLGFPSLGFPWLYTRSSPFMGKSEIRESTIFC